LLEQLAVFSLASASKLIVSCPAFPEKEINKSEKDVSEQDYTLTQNLP
jgi:hypothetical protein